MAASVADIFSSSDFRRSSMSSQRARLDDVDPTGFGSMSVSQQEAVIKAGIARTEQAPDDGFEAALERGYWQSKAQFVHLMANLTDFIPGMQDTSDGLREAYVELNALAGSDEDVSWTETAGEIMGALPIGLGTAGAVMLGTTAGLTGAGVAAGTAAALGPVLGFGALGALGAADLGPEAALKAGLTEAAFGALFPATQHMGRAGRAAILGGVTSVMTPDDMDIQQKVGHGLTMAILGSLHGAREPIGLTRRLGARMKGRDNELDVDAQKKAKAEEELLEGLERDGYERDSRREHPESGFDWEKEYKEHGWEAKESELSPIELMEGKGDPSSGSTRGQLDLEGAGKHRPPEPPHMVKVSHRDVKKNDEGRPAHPNMSLSESPGKNYARDYGVHIAGDAKARTA